MNIDVITSNGTPIELVRFFQFDGKQYLIFKEDNSLDEAGHITIRISEIGNASKMTANAVGDDNWDNVKNIIKTIVNLNKNNQPLNIQDLDYNSLEGIEVDGYKSLKLMSNYVDLLKLNQPLFEKKEMVNVVRDVPETNNNIDAVTIDSIDNFNANLNNFSAGMPLDNSVQMSNGVPFVNNVSVDNKVDTVEEINGQTNMNFNQQENVSNELNNIQFENNQNNSSNIDYQQKYLEQLEIIENLKSEIQMYQSKIETLKSIINN